MELDEAIEVLKDFAKQVKVKSDGAYQTDKGMCACMLAINALEKQIPKKSNNEIKTIPVIDEDDAYVDADTYVYMLCPICGNQVGLDDCIDNYCSCCGQKLDWSDEESEETKL